MEQLHQGGAGAPSESPIPVSAILGDSAPFQKVSPSGVQDLLTHLRRLDVRLRLAGDRLACSAPKGVLDDQLRAQLATYKVELIELLKASEFSGQGTVFSEKEKQGRLNGSIDHGDTKNGSEDRSSKLSFEQHYYWYLDKFEILGATHYNSVVLRLEGKLDSSALDLAFHEIVRRHEILRTAILTVDGLPKTRLMSNLDVSVSHIDLRSQPQLTAAVNGKAQGLALPTILDSELQRPLDLTAGNLIRATLIQTEIRTEIQTENLAHILVLVVHPIAADGRSLDLLTRELAALYLAFHEGVSPHPAPRIQYSDYSTRQRDWIDAGGLAQELPYWKERLNGATSVDLPSDRPRPAVLTHRGGQIRHQLSPEVSAAVRDLSNTEGVTLYTALLSVLYLLVYRYTGQTDLAIGSAVAGRDKPEFENLIGPLVNHVVFRTSLSGNPTGQELLRRVTETTLEGLAHQHVPFDRLVSALQPSRELNRSPFFELMFTLEDRPRSTFELPGLTIQPLEVQSGTSLFDLTIDAHENAGSIDLDLEYRSDLYDEATIRRLAIHFERLLAAMTSDPRQRISELGMFSGSEIAGILAAGQGRIIEYPRDQCISDWIDKQCTATPDAIAVCCESRETTYSELSRRSNQLARRLQDMGVACGALVGVCLDRSEELIVALLAVWKAGAAYVPMDPLYPPDRLAFMAQDSVISVLLTEDRLRHAVPIGDAVRTLAIDSDRDSIRAQSAKPIPSTAAADDLAYVIFTSGSTGTPKGVQISHRALANFLTSFLQEPGLTSGDRLLSVTTLSFDIAGLEIYLPLIAGARIILATREVASDGRRLAELMERSEASIMQATPATWRLLLEAGWKGKPGLKMICGGEAFPQDLALRLLDAGSELWNAYGPTETTIWSTLQRVTAAVHATSIGRPIANTQVVLLDEYRHLVPLGATGELYIGGDGLARGYLNRIELTRERFIDHPFSPGERLYRTGDLARWLPEGTLEFLGRIDQQAKIRGFRVELGEIEAALEAIPQIRQAVVVLRDFGAGDQRLVGYVSFLGPEEIDPLELRKLLAATLPAYMVPSHVVKLPAIPLTPNGKVDRKALPPPQVTAPVLALPRTDIQRRVALVWQDVLRTPEVGIYDNFFDIGGHSLLLVEMQSRLRNSLGCEISIQELSQNPTVVAIAEWVAVNGKGADAPSWSSEGVNWKCLVPVQPKGTRTPLFVVVGFFPDETQLILSRVIPHLEADQPVYGFSPRWIGGRGESYRTTEEMAQECLAELRTIQPSGPYLLGAYCLASSVALEMAQQLVKSGEEVSLLAMVDAGRPNGLRSALVNFSLKLELGWKRAKHIAEVLQELGSSNHSSRKQLISQIAKRKLASLKPETADYTASNPLGEFIREHWQVLQRYRPKPYPGLITLIVTEKWYWHIVREKSHRFARYMGWQGIAEGGLEIHTLPGDHTTLLTLLGKELAQLLSKCIEGALKSRKGDAGGKIVLVAAVLSAAQECQVML